MYYFCIGTFSYQVTNYSINNLIIDSAAHVLKINRYKRRQSATCFFFIHFPDGYKKKSK